MYRQTAVQTDRRRIETGGTAPDRAEKVLPGFFFFSLDECLMR